MDSVATIFFQFIYYQNFKIYFLQLYKRKIIKITITNPKTLISKYKFKLIHKNTLFFNRYCFKIIAYLKIQKSQHKKSI